MAMTDHRLLLVEDNADDEALTLRALKEHRLANEVDVVRDGAEAMDYLFGENGHPLPKLILLDLKLPRIDGIEVLARIRSTEPTRLVPVVILTASALESDIAAGYGNGANSYVQKPVDFEEFSDAVRQLGLYWLILNELPPGQGWG
jgi:two-component system, response regulator